MKANLDGKVYDVVFYAHLYDTNQQCIGQFEIDADNNLLNPATFDGLPVVIGKLLIP